MRQIEKLLASKWAKPLTGIILILGTVQGLIYATTHKLLWDQKQLLTKGILASHLHIWQHYGNKVTGGGYVPGSLTTALMGFPLVIWDNPFSIHLTIALIHLLSLYLLNDALKEYLSPAQRFFFICVFWLTPWRASKMVIWNPSFLILGTALHFWTAVKMSQKKSGLYSFLHVVAIMYAFQLHTSAVLLGIISLYLWLRKQIKVSWFGAVSGIFLSLLSLVPYYLEMKNNPQLAPIIDEFKKDYFYGRGFVYVLPLLKGLSYWPRYVSFFFPSYIFKHLDFAWITDANMRQIIRSIFLGVANIIGALTFGVSIWAIYNFVKNVIRLKVQKFLCAGIVENYLVAALLSTFVISGASPISFSHWHLFLMFPLAYIIVVKFIVEKFANSKWLGRGLLITCIYLIFYNIVAPFSSEYHSISNNIQTDYQDFVVQITPDK